MRSPVSPELAKRLRNVGFNLPVLRCYKFTEHYKWDREGKIHEISHSWDIFINPVRIKDDDPFIGEEWYEKWEEKQYTDQEGYYIFDNPYLNWNIDWKSIVLEGSDLDPSELPNIPEDLLRESVQYSSDWENEEFNQDKFLERLVDRYESYPELLETDSMACCEVEEEETGKVYHDPSDFPVQVIPDIISAPEYNDVIEWLEKEKGLHVIKGWTGTSYTMSLAEYPNLVIIGEDQHKVLEELFDNIVDYLIAFDV